MNKQELEARAASKTLLDRAIIAWQWLVAILVALVVLGLLAMTSRLSAPGAPVTLFWTAVGAGFLLATTHSPLIFSRLPKRSGWIVYAATLAYVVLWGATIADVKRGWEKTP